MVAAGCFFRCSMSAEVTRMEPSRLVLTVGEAIPGFAFVVASRCDFRRPEMMTWVFAFVQCLCDPRPIPEPPPVMKIVFPLRFMGFSFLLDNRRAHPLDANAAVLMNQSV